MAVLFPLGAVIVYCLFLLTFSERFSVSIWARREKTCLRVSDKVRFKPACLATESS